MRKLGVLVLSTAALAYAGMTAACGSDDSNPPGAPGDDAGPGSSSGGPSSEAGSTPDTGTLPDTGTPLPACNPGAADVTLTIDATKNERAISPYVYGTNLAGAWSGKTKNLTLARAGGNRWTAYNWESNASNAGNDANYANDAYLGGGATPGEAVRSFVAATNAGGAAALVTVPTQGWVAADESGPVNPAATDLTQHFHATSMQKGGALAYPPDTTDATVYEDEFVSFLEGKFPGAHGNSTKELFYSLDNEPDLWLTTHAEIQKSALTYAGFAQQSVTAATMIKRVAPAAKVFGPASYGWSGYVSLQAAPDANGRDFIEFYLDQMKAAEQAAGHRVLDVLDLHWYPEATGDGTRVIDQGTSPSAGLVDARVQAPRSLWDPSYVETSWIAQSLGKKAIALVPLMLGKIAKHYPGTALAFTEYDYGGGATISGGVAQADVLGVFGREGVFAATQWPLTGNEPFVYGAFAMFRNYDGASGSFGDTSVSAVTSNAATTSVYASVDSKTPGRMVVVAINKTTAPVKAAVTIAFGAPLTHADAWQLTSASASPAKVAAPPTPSCQSFAYTLPAMSVTTIALQ